MKTKYTCLTVAVLAAGLLVGGCLLLLGLSRPTAASPPVEKPAAPQTLPSPYLSDEDVADAPYGPSPTVDGRIAPGEYAGASKIAFPGYGGDAEAFIRQDTITLYVAFDSPDITPYPFNSGGGTGPAFQVFLDPNNSKESLPQVGDYRLTVDKGGNLMENQGNGTGWGGPPTGNWTAAVYTATWGWQAEFAIGLAKLGITQTGPISIGLGLAEVWTPSWPYDWYWPSGGYYLDPSTWGYLTSSSEWGTFYWKPGPWEDYAPSGMPDFDQRQDNWVYPSTTISTHCGPVAAANSLWWFDSKFETPDHAPPTISDTYRLVRGYLDGVDDHGPGNVIPLVDDLAGYFGTNQGISGTSVISMFFGIQDYLRDRGLWDDYIVTLVISPSFQWVADEVMRSEDVILLLGFWEEIGLGVWQRVGGHFVTVAGVDPSALLFPQIAFSDPFVDNAEAGGRGRILSGTFILPHTPGHTSEVHNDAGNVSHDVYRVLPTASPGGIWGPYDYPWKAELFGVNPHPDFPTGPYQGGFVQVEVEFALIVSPYTWKASGYWDEAGGFWQPWPDYAPHGVSDFDQKQDNWGYFDLFGIWHWSFCGPAAAANSLWWFDSKFEPGPVAPPTYNDNYPLVTTYATMPPFWDDHAPLNVDNAGTVWPPGGELVEDLARYFKTDQVGSGTIITDLYTGTVQYITDHGLRQGYVITMVQSPDFWWVAEEVEVSEDVVLLLGFWQLQPNGWVRLGGHYVTLAGVDKQGGCVAFSDPWFDRIEQTWPYAGIYRGRVADGWLMPHKHPPGPPDTIHNDAGNLSHDVYYVITTDSPGGVWGPGEYVTDITTIENFFGQNGEQTGSPLGLPVQTEVEWAVSVSPVADVWVTKTITPTVVSLGDRITFTLAFANGGSLPAEDIVLSDILPTGLISPSWSYWTSNGLAVTARPGITYTWDLPDLAWMEGGLITVTARIDPLAGWRGQTVLTNTVEVATSSVEQYQVPPLPNSVSATFAVSVSNIYLPLVMRNYP